MHKYLQDVSSDKSFKFKDNNILNLQTLLDQLERMEDGEYKDFTPGKDNYFADWVLYVIGYKDLAKKMRKAKSRKGAIRAVRESIEKLKPKKKAAIQTAAPKKEVAPILPQKTVKQQALLNSIAKDEKEIKDFLWKHFAWDMAKEFMYGMAIGILVGFILSKIFFAR